MDFTIRLRAEGTAETRAQAEAVKSVRSELEKTQKKAETAKLQPRKVREAKEDREIDRYADKIQKQLIRDDKAREKAEAKTKADAEKRIASAEKTNIKLASAQQKASDKSIDQQRKQDERKAKELDRAAEKANKDLEKYAKEESKAVERKSKDLAKATEKADKDLAKYAKDDGKAAEQRAAEAISPEMRKLSLVEKAHKKAAASKKKADKEADEALAEKIDPSLKKLSATEKAKQKFFGGIAKGAMLAGAASGAALIGIASKLAPLALGFMGMARLSMISAQAGFNMRRLFMGTNPKPLLDALQRTGQLIDSRTFTGKTLGDLLVRSSNGFFSMLAKAEPYARLFFKGMLLGALQVEGAWLQLQIAIQPAIALFPKGTGLMTAFSAGALAVKSAFALMGVGIAVGAVKAGAAMVSFGASALAATAPLLPFVAAVVALAAAYDQAIKLKAQWDENSSRQIKDKIKEDLGITTQAERDDAFDKRNKSGKYYEDRSAKPATGAAAAPTPKNAEKQAASAGPPIGKNLGLGMLAGMKDVQGKVEAGGRDLVLAAEGGAKKEAVIQSPSDKWRRQIGRQLGAGAALGLEDSAGAIEEAGRAAMPSAPGVGSGGIGRRSGIVIQQITIHGVSANDEAKMRRIAIDAFDDAAERIGALA